jgi:hypothetical protein
MTRSHGTVTDHVHSFPYREFSLSGAIFQLKISLSHGNIL